MSEGGCGLDRGTNCAAIPGADSRETGEGKGWGGMGDEGVDRGGMRGRARLH